jgi:hypothetical protein
MARNRDRSNAQIVHRPKFEEGTFEGDVWFEEGMIWFDDPESPDDVRKCTVPEFAQRIAALRAVFENDFLVSTMSCGKQSLMRFISDAEDLIKKAGGQLHVGMPIEVIAETEKERTPLSVAPGFGSSRFETRPSGLIIPH